MSGPLTSLKFRIELLNSVGNAQEDFLKRLHNRNSIVESYTRAEVNLHVHILASDGMFCAEYFCSGRVGGRPDKAELSMETDGRVFSMLVFVRDVSQGTRPVA